MPMLSKTAAEAEIRLKLLYWWYVWGEGGMRLESGSEVDRMSHLQLNCTFTYQHLQALNSTMALSAFSSGQEIFGASGFSFMASYT